ncbi:MAG: hypothetical protein LBF40_04610 [Deltaproteobacteria bacterium]|jgi:hypothetical protein|nr:hypothetical protein [Deltaproteobacteria bacterium]
MMDTQIFRLGLSVHAVSLYILVCDLADSGVRPTMDAITGRFNASKEETDLALAALVGSKVLYPNDAGDPPSYHPNPASLWETPRTGP